VVVTGRFRVRMAEMALRWRGARAAPRPPCGHRGCRGPFLGQAVYAGLETWEGFGRCGECGRTVPVPRAGTIGTAA
jgi:hypothetical protein